MGRREGVCRVKARTTADTESTVYDAWFDSVYPQEVSADDDE